MRYHCIIIGGGLAGLTCGIRCAGEGLRTAVITNGASALHAASGSIDLLGIPVNGKSASNIFSSIKRFAEDNPDHPYGKIGVRAVKSSINFIRNELESINIRMNGVENRNHLHLTALGSVKPAYLSQQSVFNDKLDKAYRKGSSAVIINFEEFRDFFPLPAEKRFRGNPLLKGKNISFKTIKISEYSDQRDDISEFRSIDLARTFDTEKYIPRLSEDIKRVSGEAEIVILPDFIGLDNYNRIHSRLEELTGKLIVEVPNLPPSILGMRLEKGLRSLFANYGGELTPGRVNGGFIKGDCLDYITTDSTPGYSYRADYYLLSTGSFFSGGLAAGFDHIIEPVFRLKVKSSRKRKGWHSSRFLDSKSHPFMGFGVETDSNMNPFTGNYETVKNLYCAGAVLSGYDPVLEGSGGGVAISTGYHAAEKIIRGCKKK